MTDKEQNFQDAVWANTFDLASYIEERVLTDEIHLSHIICLNIDELPSQPDKQFKYYALHINIRSKT